jgi:hypothetical protein
MNVHHMLCKVVTPIASDPSCVDRNVEKLAHHQDAADDIDTKNLPPLSPNYFFPLASLTSIDDDQLQAMLSIEEARYEIPMDYLLKVGTRSALNGYANSTWRGRLCEWMFEVADHFGFDREVVSISSYIMDRMASLAFDAKKQNFATKREYQLNAVSSLYLALKVHGKMDPESGEERVKLPLSNFVELSRGFFTEEVIAAKESQILNALNWHINPPTCAQFLSEYLEFLPHWTIDDDSQDSKDNSFAPHQVIWVKVFDVAKYLTELSVFGTDFAFGHKPSITSYAALLCALEYVQHQTPFPRSAQFQLIDRLSHVSSMFCCQIGDIQHLQTKLKKLAFDFFPERSTVTRTVSMSEIDSVNDVVAAFNNDKSYSKRSVFPTCASEAQQEPTRKKARRTLRRDTCCAGL